MSRALSPREVTSHAIGLGLAERFEHAEHVADAVDLGVGMRYSPSRSSGNSISFMIRSVSDRILMMR